MTRLKIQLLVDNPNSWIVPYTKDLLRQLRLLGHDCDLLNNHKDVKEGDILCLLACENIFKNLSLNKHNLVVHESDLPKGKGWSPLTWQVLEGENKIPITLFEASDKIDAGVIYNKKYIELKGSELLAEIRHQQGLYTNRLILDFIKNYPNNPCEEQHGEATFYQKRDASSSEMDPTKTLIEQFNLLRVCDNENYPAYFIKDGHKYVIKIYKND